MRPVLVVPVEVEVQFSQDVKGGAKPWRGTIIRLVHSSLSVRMKRSTTAMLPYLPTAPNRALMVLCRHQALKSSHQNCLPLSEMMYFGLALA